MDSMLRRSLLKGFAFLLLYISCNASEPHCSRFPYEEALLEKMIRMEIKVEHMEKRILAARDQVLQEVDTIKEHRTQLDEWSRTIVQDIKDRQNEMEQVMAKFQNDVNRDLAEKSSKMESVFEQKEAQISRMSEDLMTLKNTTLQSFKNSIQASAVYFRAKVTKKLSYSKNEVMLFDTVLNKLGDHYNPTTGKFTAPENGVYLFTVQLCFPSNDGVEFNFKVDGKVEQAGWNYDSTSDTCETSCMMKNLEAGSSVWVENNYSNRLRDDKLYRWNIFSGTLISNIV